MLRGVTGAGVARPLLLVATWSLISLTAGGLIRAAGASHGSSAEPQRSQGSPGRAADRTADAEEERAGRRGWRPSVFPVVFTTPETGFGGGAACVLTHRSKHGADDALPHSISVIFYYTEKRQSNLAIAPDLYFGQGRWHVKVPVAYQKLPSYFYQAGSYHAKDYLVDDDAEDYTLEAASFEPWVLWGVHSRLRAGLVCDLRKATVLRVERAGILDQGLVHGHDGGVLSGLGPALEWDSRDHVFHPSRGGWYQLYARVYRSGIGSDLDFEAYWLDLRQYVTARTPHILAFQVWWSKRAGDIPFTDYAAIGRQMRGIHAERLQDRHAVVAQAEYRYPIWGSFSGVAFASLGEVARSVDSVALSATKYAAGAGLRYALNADEKLNVRFDGGVSEWGA